MPKPRRLPINQGEPLGVAPTPETNLADYLEKTVTIFFEARDKKLREQLQHLATDQRRSLEGQILHILDQHCEDVLGKAA